MSHAETTDWSDNDCCRERERGKQTDIESRALTSFPSPHCFWKSYVDDTCCALRTYSVETFTATSTP